MSCRKVRIGPEFPVASTVLAIGYELRSVLPTDSRIFYNEEVVCLPSARGRPVMKSTGWMDRFVPLPENRSALLAVQRLADGDGVHAAYLHGPSGSGKSHLARLLVELFGKAA